MINVVRKKKHKEECINYRAISLVLHAGKMLLKVINRRLSGYYGLLDILPGKSSYFRLIASTTGMLSVIRQLRS